MDIGSKMAFCCFVLLVAKFLYYVRHANALDDRGNPAFYLLRTN